MEKLTNGTLATTTTGVEVIEVPLSYLQSFIFQKDLWYRLNHCHIWQVSLQLSYGDTCQIWTRYVTDK